MKCPLILAGYWSSAPGFNTPKTGCIEEECAWWIPKFGCCAVCEMVITLRATADELSLIREILPERGKV